ncbi:MAG: GTP-binding protein [Planctomycetes bacterium]|nr:GTP-binding protein [Planctomycetota bacterium]MCB9871684.1 GTP-binding protein [Planctomycetota bacterium]
MRPLARLRNIGIVAHINAGKTTLTERFLFRSGAQPHMGEVDEGTATMDFMPEEQERGISISAAVASLDWRGFHLNLIDTPGHVDFTAEVERSLQILDGVVVVIDGIHGVESQTEIVWRQAQAHRIPALVFINKLDRETADFEASLISLGERLGCVALPVVLPVRRDGVLVGLIDLVEDTCTLPAEFDPASWRPSRQAVIEACADFDESILADFVAGEGVDPERLHRALRRATMSGRVVPVLAGSALLDHGVDWLLSAVCRYLPSPLQRPRTALDGQEVHPDPERPFCALVFKVQFDDVARLAFVRIYRGSLRPGERVGGSRHDAPFGVRALWRIHAAHREPLEELFAGDVAALEADALLSTGETLFAPDHPVSLEAARFPPPVLTSRIEVARASDLPEVEAAARQLCAEDPTLDLATEDETGALLVSGMGELHLGVFGERLAAAVKGSVRLGSPRVMLRQTIRTAVRASGECRRHIDGAELAVRVELDARPVPGGGPATVVDVDPAVIPDPTLRRAARALLAAQLANGLAEPAPAHDLEVEIVGLTAAAAGHGGEAALGDALAIACRRIAADGGLVTLEPFVAWSVSCPTDTLSGALSDLRSRGAEIGEVTSHGRAAEVHGELPLARLLGYATKLRSLTRGLGTLYVRPLGLRPVVARAARG